jgi:hypothetical protein
MTDRKSTVRIRRRWNYRWCREKSRGLPAGGCQPVEDKPKCGDSVPRRISYTRSLFVRMLRYSSFFWSWCFTSPPETPVKFEEILAGSLLFGTTELPKWPGGKDACVPYISNTALDVVLPVYEPRITTWHPLTTCPPDVNTNGAGNRSENTSKPPLLPICCKNRL